MVEIFTDFFNWMAALPAAWMYLTILVIAYGENVAPPIPGDMVVVYGGYLAGVGKLNLVAVVGLSTLGGALGFMTMYAIGHRLGEAMLDPQRMRFLPKDRVQKARKAVRRWGYSIVVANRFLSGLRSVISLTVGMVHMKAGRTTLYATLSALVWTAIIAYLGYLAGENWQVVKGYLATYGRVIIGLIILFAGVQSVRFYRRYQRNKEAARAAAETDAGGFMDP